MHSLEAAPQNISPRLGPGGVPLALWGLVGATTVLFLSNAMLPAMLEPVVKARFGLTDRQVSMFFILPALAHLMFGLAVGYFSDRQGRRMPLLAWSYFGVAAMTAVLPFLQSYTAMLAVRFLWGVADAVAATLLFAKAADLSEHTGKGRAMAVMGMAVSVGYLIGQPVAALADLRPELPFLATALATGAVGAAFLRQSGAPESLAATTHRILPALRRILPVRALWPALLFGFVDKYTFAAIALLTGTHIATAFGDGSVLTPALAIAGFWIGSLAAAWPSGVATDRFGAMPVMLAASAVYGLCLAAMGAVGIGGFYALMAVCGGFSALMYTPSVALVARHAPADLRGAAMAVFQLVGMLGLILGFAATGILSARFGSGAAYAVAGSFELVAVALVGGAIWLRRASAEGPAVEAPAPGRTAPHP